MLLAMYNDPYIKNSCMEFEDIKSTLFKPYVSTKFQHLQPHLVQSIRIKMALESVNTEILFLKKKLKFLCHSFSSSVPRKLISWPSAQIPPFFAPVKSKQYGQHRLGRTFNSLNSSGLGGFSEHEETSAWVPHPSAPFTSIFGPLCLTQVKSIEYTQSSVIAFHFPKSISPSLVLLVLSLQLNV